MAQLTRSTGKVTWFDNIKGYGFIKPDDGGADLFVHHKSIKSDGYRTLYDNQPVEFDVQLEPDGKYQALDVTSPGGGPVHSSKNDNGYGRGGGRGGNWKGSNGNRRNDNGYSSGGVVCYNCDGVGHLARDCTSNKRNGNYNTGGCYNCGDPEHYARDCPIQHNGNGGGGGGGGGGCFKCGGYGHLARDCVNRGIGSGRCYTCGKSGHLARDCIEGSGGGGGGGGGGRYTSGVGGGGSCFNCGKPGHFARECTKV